jgi:broad specificity phosphatase PhoE
VNNEIIGWLNENTPRNASLLLRHAHRHPIPKGVIEHESVPLTRKGRHLAFEFGVGLPLSYSVRLFHSPIPRCKETAVYIQKGFQHKGGSANVMGEQEFLIIHLGDQREMVEILDRIGHQKFGYAWLKGKFKETIIENPQTVASKTINGIVALMDPDGDMKIDIHITHDLNILAVREVIAPVPNDHFKWPAYLHGIIFTQHEDSVTLIQRPFSKTIEK